MNEHRAKGKQKSVTTSPLQAQWEKTATRQDEVVLDVLLQYLDRAVKSIDVSHE